MRVIILTALVAGLSVPFWCQKSSDGQFIQNLRAFAKLYGYIRYFHPSDEAAQVDWEKFAVIGVERVKRAGTSQELKSILEELFLPIAPTAQIYLNGETPKDPPPFWPKMTTSLKVVAWQHRGVGSGSANSPYASIRINRANVLKVATTPAVLTQTIDATPYLGREIKLKALVKLDGKEYERRGYLWLRVDRKNNQMGFFDNMGNRPIRASIWKEFEITGKVAEDAAQIVFGGMTDSGERLWLDGFELLARDEKGRWKAVPIKNPGFEDGLLDQAPAEWATPSQGYHYKISRRNPAQGKQCLMIEPAVLVVPAKLFDKIPAVGEKIQKKLTGDISCQIPLILYSDEKETLGKNDVNPFDPLMKSLAATKIEDWTVNNEAVRLADVVIAWNIASPFSALPSGAVLR
jgi:hypothetical protein